jgi:hypothetical protein
MLCLFRNHLPSVPEHRGACLTSTAMATGHAHGHGHDHGRGRAHSCGVVRRAHGGGGGVHYAVYWAFGAHGAGSSTVIELLLVTIVIA